MPAATHAEQCRVKVGRGGWGLREPFPGETGRRAGTCLVPEGATGPGPSAWRSSAGSEAGGKAVQVCVLVGGGSGDGKVPPALIPAVP